MSGRGETNTLCVLAFYADRGGDMVDLDGNLVGNCVVDGSDGYTCTDGMAGYSGRSQLRCTTGLIIP